MSWLIPILLVVVTALLFLDVVDRAPLSDADLSRLDELDRNPGDVQGERLEAATEARA